MKALIAKENTEVVIVEVITKNATRQIEEII